MATANDLNISQAGIVAFDGTATFSGRTITGGTGITVTNGNGVSGNPTIALSGGGVAFDSITPNSGTSPVIPDVNGNVTIQGTGSLTTVGGLNSLTPQLTGLTNHAVLVGAGTATITKLTVGSTGQYLTGVTGADPVFSTPTQFNTLTAQRFTATGAFTYTPTSGMKFVLVELQGGGGASGGAAATVANVATSGPGGAGGYARFILTAVQVGASVNGSVGVGGTAGTAGNNAGGNGGDTTLATSGAWTAGGGVGGGGSAAGASSSVGPGAGGTVTSGTGTILLTATGGTGSTSVGNAASVIALCGPGGNSILGSGGQPGIFLTISQTGVGRAGSGFGSGAAGSTGIGTNSAVAGQAGNAGIAIFTEFCS